MLKLFVLLFASVGWAQTATTLTLSGPASAPAGTNVTLTLSSSATTGTVADLQWKLVNPSGFPLSAGTSGAALSAAGKQLYCTADQIFCMAAGMGATGIANGVVATYTMSIPSTATAGTVSLSLINMIATDPAALGAGFVPTQGPAYALNVTTGVVSAGKWDLNGDGKVDATDLQLMINQVIAAQTNPAACINDLNGNGKCDILDVFQIVLKALGLI